MGEGYNKNQLILLKMTTTLNEDDIKLIVETSVENYIKKNSFEHAADATIGSILFVIFLLIVLGSLSYLFFESYKKHNCIKIPKDSRRNCLWVLVWIISSVILICSLYYYGLIHPTLKEGIWFSHADILLIVASIIAIIGAIWAILARIDAERAFNKSQETLDALGNTFKFYDVLNKDKIFGIIDKIGKSDFAISLFIGFPYIGYLYEEKNKFHILPEDAFEKLTHKLDTLKSSIVDTKYPINNYKFSISVFPEDISLQLVEKYANENKSVKENEVTEIQEKIKEFYKRIKIIKSLGKAEIIIDENMSTDENLRFVSLEFKTNNFSFKDNKVLVWIIKDLSNTEVSFDTQCFQSSDLNLISIVQTAFDSKNKQQNGETNSTPKCNRSLMQPLDKGLAKTRHEAF